MISIPLVVFFALDSVDLVLAYGPWPLAFAVWLALLAIASFLKSAFSDPGIVPRLTHDEDEALTNESGVQGPEARGAGRGLVMPRDVHVRNELVKVKYCKTCRLFRPPRAVHCSVCDNCVLAFDHHCPWIGNCVGRLNYRYFVTFIFSTSALCLTVLVLAGMHMFAIMNARDIDLGLALIAAPQDTFLCLYTPMVLMMVAGLGCFHCGLIIDGATSNENLKYIPHAHYSLGCWRNAAVACCASTVAPLDFSAPAEGQLGPGFVRPAHLDFNYDYFELD